jgi:hypothetical protein
MQYLRNANKAFSLVEVNNLGSMLVYNFASSLRRVVQGGSNGSLA